MRVSTALKAVRCLVSAPADKTGSGDSEAKAFDTILMQGMRPMTQLLEEAIQQIHNLPAAQQDAIAAVILDELADEQQWDAAFARSQDKLARMAEKVREDIKAARVKTMGIDEL